MITLGQSGCTLNAGNSECYCSSMREPTQMLCSEAPLVLSPIIPAKGGPKTAQRVPSSTVTAQKTTPSTPPRSGVVGRGIQCGNPFTQVPLPHRDENHRSKVGNDIPAIVLVRLEPALQRTRGSRSHYPRAVSRCSRRPSGVIAERKPRCRVGDVRRGEAADRSGRPQQTQGVHVAHSATVTNQARRQ